jgi:transcription initiation factor TFIID subunit 2
MDEGRGFTLSHQRVALDINFSGVITASAHLTILPTSPNLRTINIHASPLLQITNVSLSSPTPTDPLLSTPASYALSQAFQPLPFRDPPVQIRSHTEIKRKTWAAIHERDEGELAISVTGGWIRLLDGDTALAPIEIQVDYRLIAGEGTIEGIVFDGEAVYLSPTAYDSARVWTPCLDSLWDRCTWEIEFIVPATIYGCTILVVSSGELLEQVGLFQVAANG